MEQVHVKVPQGMAPGQEIQFPNPRGRMFKARIPPGVTAGMTFLVEIPLVPGGPVATPARRRGHRRGRRHRRTAAAAAAAGGAAAVAVPVVRRRARSPTVVRRRAHLERSGDEQLQAAIEASRQQAQEDTQLQAALAASAALAAASEARRAPAAAPPQPRPSWTSWLGGGAADPPPPPPVVAEVSPDVPSAMSARVSGELADLMDMAAIGSGERLGVAEEHAECPICFDELCEKPCVSFHRGAGPRRACMHFLHESCAAELPTKSCPLCRAPFDRCERLPNLAADPQAWFERISAVEPFPGQLSKQQVSTAMVTQFPLNVAAFERALDELWVRWDHDGSGAVDRAEFFAPGVGMLDFVKENLLRVKPAARRIPDIRTKRMEWFDHFDDSRSGTLAQEEVVRALIKTYGLSADLAGVRQMREMVAAVWAVFSVDGSSDEGGLPPPRRGLCDTSSPTRI